MTFIEARPLSQERADYLEGYRSPVVVRIRRECHQREWREVFEQMMEMLNGDEVVRFWTERAHPVSYYRVERRLSMRKAAVAARRRSREKRMEEQARERTERARAVEVIGGARVRLESFAEAAEARSWLDLLPEAGT